MRTTTWPVTPDRIVHRSSILGTEKRNAAASPPPNARRNLVIEQSFAYTLLGVNKFCLGPNVAAEAGDVKYLRLSRVSKSCRIPHRCPRTSHREGRDEIADTHVSRRTMSVVFKNPPINEVVIATYFNAPLSSFRSEHVGLFWQKIRSEFPVVHQQPPSISPMEIAPDIGAGEFLPMPRYWFVAQDETYIIQVQKNAFMFNWRRRDSAKYPGFHDSVKPAFDKYYDLFDEFVQTELDSSRLSVGSCELTYINSIETCELWAGPEDTTNVVPSFSVPAHSTNVAATPHFNSNYIYDIGANDRLSVGIKDGTRTQQSDKPVLILEIKVIGKPEHGAKSAVDRWFQATHDHIFKCFVGVTSKEMQNRYWEPTEETE